MISPRQFERTTESAIGQFLQVSTVQILAGHPWCDRYHLHELNTDVCSFADWEPDTRLQAGDTLTYIEATGLVMQSTPSPGNLRWLR